MKFFLLSLAILLSIHHSFAKKGKAVHLRKAKKLKGVVIDGERVNKLIGDVVFEHEGTKMYCDSAYQYSERNEMHAFGHVKIVQKKDDVTLYSDKLIYYGNTRLAKVRDNVILEDGNMTLYTDFLDYDMKNRQAIYFNFGRIKDDSTTLTSVFGRYDIPAKKYFFKDSVKVVQPSYTLKSDTLVYNIMNKLTHFFGPTHIESKTQYLYAEKGKYNTQSQKSYFKKNARVEDDEYILIGDSIYFDNQKEEGYAYKNVALTSKKDSLVITGNELFRWGKTGTSKVIGDAVLQKRENTDTLYLSSDTLISIDNPNKQENYITAYSNVLLWRSDMQGKCDSLVYEFSDSTIQFYQAPVLWSAQNQVTADSIKVELKNKKMHRMYANVNSFLISEDEDDATNFNQIKGRNMIAYFVNNSIEKVDVIGNGQSIYFAKDGDTQDVMGMNNVTCANMLILFEENELKNISFLTEPDAKFIPPFQLSPGDKTLKDFKWLIDQKPNKESALRIKTKTATNAPPSQETLNENPGAEPELSRKEKRRLRKEERRKRKEEKKKKK
ncbi:MAG: hypothetical protein GY827_10465 [Cytophagales bacterium]|nr:hypothetical protein [Cytophagales bacterium]